MLAKISMLEASKRFNVSRPTLLKHLKNGQISGNKDTGKGWQIDTSELARVYQARGGKDGNTLPDALSPVANDLQNDLLLENERLKTRVAVAEALAEERGKRLDQLVPMLTDQRKQRWWPF